MNTVFTISVLSIALCIVRVFAQQGKYCDPTMCQTGRHIGCGNKNKFAETCPKDAKLVKSENYKKVFVKEHNRVRNLIATGSLAGYLPAMRMATVKWDNELVKLAQMQAKTCVNAYDECRNTVRFIAVGQNIATITRIGRYSVAELIREVVNGWFSEGAILDRSYVTEYRIDNNYKASRHFSQLVLDKVTRIGCAVVDFTEGTKTRVNIVCNYSSRPMHTLPLYIEGCSVAQCIRGHNTKFQGLCAPSEMVDPNGY